VEDRKANKTGVEEIGRKGRKERKTSNRKRKNN